MHAPAYCSWHAVVYSSVKWRIYLLDLDMLKTRENYHFLLLGACEWNSAVYKCRSEFTYVMTKINVNHGYSLTHSVWSNKSSANLNNNRRKYCCKHRQPSRPSRTYSHHWRCCHCKLSALHEWSVILQRTKCEATLYSHWKIDLSSANCCTYYWKS